MRNAPAKTLPMVPVLSLQGHNNARFRLGHRRPGFRREERNIRTVWV